MERNSETDLVGAKTSRNSYVEKVIKLMEGSHTCFHHDKASKHHKLRVKKYLKVRRS